MMSRALLVLGVLLVVVTLIFGPGCCEPQFEATPPWVSMQQELEQAWILYNPAIEEFAGVQVHFDSVLRTRQMESLTSYIENEGTQVAANDVRWNTVGYNNAARVIEKIAQGLSGNMLNCLGYRDGNGKLGNWAVLIYDGLAFPWDYFGMRGARGWATGFHFFPTPSGWYLWLITPVGAESLSAAVLTPCRSA